MKRSIVDDLDISEVLQQQDTPEMECDASCSVDGASGSVGGGEEKEVRNPSKLDDLIANAPFDPNSMRETGEEDIEEGELILTTIPVGKPGKQIFFRVKEDLNLKSKVLEYTGDGSRQLYLVKRDLWGTLAGDLKSVWLWPYVDQYGKLGIWPIGTGHLTNSWTQSALKAMEMAKSNWIRMIANQRNGMYDVYRAINDQPEPKWPDLTLQAMIIIAFTGYYIDDMNHPVVKALQGM